MSIYPTDILFGVPCVVQSYLGFFLYFFIYFFFAAVVVAVDANEWLLVDGPLFLRHADRATHWRRE